MTSQEIAIEVLSLVPNIPADLLDEVVEDILQREPERRAFYRYLKPAADALRKQQDAVAFSALKLST